MWGISNIKKVLGEVMGGNILEHPAKTLRNQGRAEGDKERLISIIKKKLEKGKSIEEIADAVEENVEKVMELINEINKNR